MFLYVCIVTPSIISLATYFKIHYLFFLVFIPYTLFSNLLLTFIINFSPFFLSNLVLKIINHHDVIYDDCHLLLGQNKTSKIVRCWS